MASLSGEEQELIQRDRVANPGCFYSTALSKSCRSIDGDSKCEIIKKIFRQCPNARKELISNRKEITEDELGGEATANDFYNREKMEGDQEFGTFFPQRGDNFEAQMNPFDFIRQEMLRPFEDFFSSRWLARDNLNSFEGLERGLDRLPVHPPSPTPGRPSHLTPPEPPHYSFPPSYGKGVNGKLQDADAKARALDKDDMFADYSGHVEEI